jgi:ribosome-associated toxin RatA of RatAB toxin-antitoxin module
MTTLHNEIIIDAPIEKIWAALSDIEKLERYDPLVKTSHAISQSKHGIGAARKVEMKDGKNWFEEKCTNWNPNESLTYELTACSFPVHRLKHSYRFEKVGKQIKVRQLMEYEIKYGLLGALLDKMMIRKQTDSGIKKFFAGLKTYSEKQA